MKIYMELKERKSKLTRKGYLTLGQTSLTMPFVLTDKEFGDEFINYPAEANRAVRKLNFHFFESVKINFEE